MFDRPKPSAGCSANGRSSSSSSSGMLYKLHKYVLPIQPYKNYELMKDSLVPITGKSKVTDVWHPIL